MENFTIAPGSPAFLALCLAGWLLLVNSMTIVAFRIDRRRAKAGEWRVPKETLLILVSLGGWPGAKLTQMISRHKLHRRPFRALMDLSIIPMALAAVYLAALHPQLQEMSVNDTASVPEHAATAPVAISRPNMLDVTKISATSETIALDNPELPRRFGAIATNAVALRSR